MGANAFEDYGWGPDAQSAFNATREHAQWEHGHGGYSGTIAEKGSFSLFVLPPRVTSAKMLAWIAEYDDVDVSWQRETLKQAKDWLATKPAGKIRVAQAQVRDAEKRLKAAEKTRAAYLKKVGPHLNLIERAAMCFDDKWGTAVAFEIPAGAERTKLSANYYVGKAPKRGWKLFVFAGYASS